MKYLISLLSLLLSMQLFSQSEPIIIGEKIRLQSDILQETRYVNIYLPHSYKITDHTKYPVLYLIDGDYNFHYVTGMIDQMAVLGEKIPEMIVVGISDAGHDRYVQNCTPFDKKKNPDGNAENFLSFIEKELKPYVQQNYRMADYSVLVGHSLGGLFVINTLLTNPTAFDCYVAISPSLWWDDYGPEKAVEKFYADHEKLGIELYLSVGNEEGMGVYGFYDQMDIQTFADHYYQNEPLGLRKEFVQFDQENHNSVGLPSLKYALDHMFEGYDIAPGEFEQIHTFQAYESKLQSYREKIGDGFRLPPRQFNQVLKKVYAKDNASFSTIEVRIKSHYPASLSDFYHFSGNLYLKNKEIDKGLEYLQKSIEVSPNALETMVSLAEAYTAQKQEDKAQEWYKKALQMAEERGVSNWYRNELRSRVKR